jgi:hypothetical protein
VGLGGGGGSRAAHPWAGEAWQWGGVGAPTAPGLQPPPHSPAPMPPFPGREPPPSEMGPPTLPPPPTDGDN